MRRIFIGLIGAFLIISCGQAPAPAEPSIITDQTVYSIVASTSIVADIAQQIVGDNAHVISIVGPGSDAHVYEPAPADGVRIAKASALVAIGLEFEPWFEELYASSGSSAPYIEASAGITPIELSHADEASTEADAHGHGEYDPHVWQDVQNVIMMATNLSEAFIKVMPEHADSIRANTESYIATLESLDREIVAQMAQIPTERRVFVTNHDTMSYFAKRYNFRLVGTVLGSVTTESGDPGANSIINLVAAIQESNAPAIFIEAFGNDDLINTIAAEAGVTIAPALYTDALGEPGSDGESYVKMMRYNSQTIYQALGATSNQ